MIGKLKASSRGDRTDSKKESRYASISCSGYTVVRIGSIGGKFDRGGDGAGYVAASGDRLFHFVSENLCPVVV